MIKFDERKWLKDVIENRNQQAITNNKYLVKYLIKYYYPQFKNKTAVEFKEFIINEMNLFHFDNARYEEWELADYIDRLCKKALKGEFNVYLRELEYVDITQAEMDIIEQAQTNNHKKLLFTLYVLAKLYPYRSGWVNFRDSEIFKLANIHLNFRERHFLVNDLYTQGLLGLNHIIGKVSYKVNLVEDSPAVCRVSREDHFGNQYLLYVKNHEWTMCEKCGRLIKKHSPNQKYCQKCAQIIQKNQIKQWKRENSENERKPA